MCQSTKRKPANFHNKICKSQIHKFLQNRAKLCLKTVIIVVFLKEFFILYKFVLEHYMLYLDEERVCISSRADFLVIKNLEPQIEIWQSARFAEGLQI